MAEVSGHVGGCILVGTFVGLSSRERALSLAGSWSKDKGAPLHTSSQQKNIKHELLASSPSFAIAPQKGG